MGIEFGLSQDIIILWLGLIIGGSLFQNGWAIIRWIVFVTGWQLIFKYDGLIIDIVIITIIFFACEFIYEVSRVRI